LLCHRLESPVRPGRSGAPHSRAAEAIPDPHRIPLAPALGALRGIWRSARCRGACWPPRMVRTHGEVRQPGSRQRHDGPLVGHSLGAESRRRLTGGLEGFKPRGHHEDSKNPDSTNQTSVGGGTCRVRGPAPAGDPDGNLRSAPTPPCGPPRDPSRVRLLRNPARACEPTGISMSQSRRSGAAEGVPKGPGSVHT
jgi:hypothetical protein